jgi:hypothetical protein
VGRWSFCSPTTERAIAGTIAAPRAAFAGLRYANPPGGTKDCLNTRLSWCELTAAYRATWRQEDLCTGHPAAFALFTDERLHGIPISA